jgi:hypothetical protein
MLPMQWAGARACACACVRFFELCFLNFEFLNFHSRIIAIPKRRKANSTASRINAGTAYGSCGSLFI